jgi:ABC-2 type transport system permease protein
MTESTATAEDVLEARRKERVPGLPAGWRVIAAKEFADHLLSVRFLILLILLGVLAAYTVYAVSGSIRDLAQEATGSPELFVFLFRGAAEPTEGVGVSFLMFVGLLGPLLGIAFGFDAVSAERSEGTLPRLVSQPIHRDDVINGKFVAGLSTIALILGAVMVLIAGISIIRLGVTPTEDQVLRILTWFVVATVYVGFWLAFAMLCSVIFRRAATAALATMSAWIVFVLFWDLIGPVIANVISPRRATAAVADQVAALTMQQNLLRISPARLFTDISSAVLNPAVNTLGFVLPEDRPLPTLLPYGQSILVAWPLVVALVALTVVCFAAAYVIFMRQEVRA